MPKYYDWQKTFSYGDADIVIVVGNRGYGKTYGIRKQFIKDAKKGYKFVEIVRHKNELKGDAAIQHGYFDKLSTDDEFKDVLLKTQGVRAYMAEIPKEGDKPKWQVIGYFVAMTEAQELKKRTFTNVKRILLDEGLLERDNQYKHYLPNEYERLANIIDTVTRERSDNQSVKPTLYILGNAVDITNPIFARLGITKEPKRGYSWYANKHVLLHYVSDDEYAKGKMEGTVAGRMLAGTKQGLENVENRFSLSNEHEIANKTPNAKLQFTIAYENRKYGVWLDLSQGYYYITGKAPDLPDIPVYALTNDDMKPNYIMIQMVRKQLQGIANLYYMGIIKYDNEQTRNTFLKVLSVLGIKYK